MLKIYHIPLLVLVFILLLSSCAVNRTVNQNDVVLTKNKIKLANQQANVMYAQALEQLKVAQPEAYQFYQQARAAEVRGELEIAIESYHKAIQKAPENSLLLTALGMVYLRNEDIIPARRYLLKAVSYNPGYFKPKLGLGYIYLKNQQLQKSILQLEDSLQLLTTVEGTLLLAEAKEGQGNLLEAKQLYQAVVQVDKKSKLGKAAATRLRSLSK